MRSVSSLAGILGAMGLAAATPYSVALDTRQCTALPARAAEALGPEWRPFAGLAERCSVPGPAGHIAITVDIIRLDRSEAAGVLANQATRIPLPVIRDAAGRIVATLPQQFPVEGPGRLKVRFTRWRGDAPRTIVLYEAGESALPPHPLPALHRDPQSGMYR